MSQDDQLSFAVTVTRAEGVWDVRTFEDDFEDITVAVKAVRSLRLSLIHI